MTRLSLPFNWELLGVACLPAPFNFTCNLSNRSGLMRIATFTPESQSL